MKKSLFVLLIAFIACTGCTHSKKIAAVNALSSSGATEAKAAVPEEQQDGSSFEKAVFIKENNESKGVAAEYAWLKEHYPGYVSNGQSLQRKGKKSYDVISITTKDGEKKDMYFDISGFYGKW